MLQVRKILLIDFWRFSVCSSINNLRSFECKSNCWFWHDDTIYSNKQGRDNFLISILKRRSFGSIPSFLYRIRNLNQLTEKCILCVCVCVHVSSFRNRLSRSYNWGMSNNSQLAIKWNSKKITQAASLSTYLFVYFSFKASTKFNCFLFKCLFQKYSI